MSSSRVSIPAQFVQSAHDGDIDGVQQLFQERGERLVLATLNAALMAATEKGHLHVVQCLVETMGANAEAMDANGVMPLLVAQQNGHGKVVRYLKSVVGVAHIRVQRASPAIAGHVMSPSATRDRFEEAAKNGDLATVQNLFQRHGHVIVKENDALLLAIQHGHLPIVKFLVGTVGSNLEWGDGNGEYSPLHRATASDQIEIVQYLVSMEGANVETVNDYGRTALHSASIYGSVSMVRYLVGMAGSNPNVHDIAGETPLHWACKFGRLDIVQCLISMANANVEAADKYGRTPLHVACEWWGRVGIAHCLIVMGNANVQAADKNGLTPWHTARSHRRVGVLYCLIANIEF
jgi:ankyrin repeat protein